jgi:dienelactone hydrolase
MNKLFPLLMVSAITGSFSACGDNTGSTAANQQTSGNTAATTTAAPAVKEEAVSYTAGGGTMNSFVAYDEARQGRRPVVLVLPEWWGLTEYSRARARMLAEMGYLAMAVDLYGDGKVVNSPEEAQKAAGLFYNNSQLARQRIDAARQKAHSLPQADTTKMAVIGYCFGGSMALDYGKMGAPVLGVVSFHGGLEGVPPQKQSTAQFLICHGGADDFV